MIEPGFQRTLKRTAVAHGALIAALLVWPLLQTLLLNRKAKPEQIALIDLQVAMTTPRPQVAVPEEKPPEPEPKKPDPPKPPDPKPTEIPKEIKPVRTNTLAKATEIKVSTNRVKIAQQKPKDTGPKLTKEQIEKLLAMGIPKGDTTSIPGGGEASLFSAYYLMMRQVMYDAWQQPAGLAGSGLYATIKFRIQRDGSITARSLTRSSGNRELDDSALRAANAVGRLRPLPTGYSGSYKDITVDFELTGAF